MKYIIVQNGEWGLCVNERDLFLSTEAYSGKSTKSRDGKNCDGREARVHFRRLGDTERPVTLSARFWI